MPPNALGNFPKNSTARLGALPTRYANKKLIVSSTHYETGDVVLSIELKAAMRNAIAFLTRSASMTRVPPELSSGEKTCHGCEILMTRRCCVCQDQCSHLGGHPYDAQRCAVPKSCPSAFGDWPQEGVHRNGEPGDLTQTFGETQGRLFATSEDVAQVRVGALGSIGKLPDGHFVGFGPAKHRVWF